MYKLYSGRTLVATGEDKETILDHLTKELTFWTERGYGFVDVTTQLVPDVICAFIAVADGKSNVLLTISESET